MAIVPKNESGVALKWKHHFPLRLVTRPSSGNGLNVNQKKTVLYDRFQNELGEFDRRVDAEARAEEIRKNPELLNGYS